MAILDYLMAKFINQVQNKGELEGVGSFELSELIAKQMPT